MNGLIYLYKRWRTKRKIMTTISVLNGLDKILKRTGISRQQRRVFLRSLQKSPDGVITELEKLLKIL